MENRSSPPNATPLDQEPWLIEFLRGKDFERVRPEKFSNGRATLTFKGTEFTAEVGQGGPAWRGNLEDADPDIVKAVLGQLLQMREFRSEAQLAREQAQRERGQQALAGIAQTIRTGPDTSGGVQLRRFLWSLYNQHHLVNLWRLTATLDAQHAGWAAEVFAGALAGALEEDDLKRCLGAAGQFEAEETIGAGR